MNLRSVSADTLSLVEIKEEEPDFSETLRNIEPTHTKSLSLVQATDSDEISLKAMLNQFEQRLSEHLEQRDVPVECDFSPARLDVDLAKLEKVLNRIAEEFLDQPLNLMVITGRIENGEYTVKLSGFFPAYEGRVRKFSHRTIDQAQKVGIQISSQNIKMRANYDITVALKR